MDAQLPPKAALDAETDQMLAMIRDNRLSHAPLTTGLAEGLADQIREQFGPGSGRIVMAVAQAVGCIEKVMREDHGVPMTVGHLLVITALAAEQLEREHPS